MGSTAFTLISLYGFGAADPSRVAAQIVSGIGFIGAGAIMRQGLSVRGLTTAATLWLVASIGMAVGVGWYEEALAVTGVALVALIVLSNVERHLPAAKSAVTVQLRLAVSPGTQGAIKDLLHEGGWIVRRGHMEKTSAGQVVHLTYLVRRHRGSMAEVEGLTQKLEGLEGIRELGWEVLEVSS
jgi:putative Mg2+ transporter-C (MgtC) family protein